MTWEGISNVKMNNGDADLSDQHCNQLYGHPSSPVRDDEDGLQHVHILCLSTVLVHLPNPDQIHFAEYAFHSLSFEFAKIHHNYSPIKN